MPAFYKVTTNTLKNITENKVGFQVTLYSSDNRTKTFYHEIEEAPDLSIEELSLLTEEEISNLPQETFEAKIDRELKELVIDFENTKPASSELPDIVVGQKVNVVIPNE